MNYRAFFDLHGIKCQEGLSDGEIKRIEGKYDLIFPDDLRNLLQQALPTAKGFYDWRDFSESNVQFVLQAINRPFDDFYNDAAGVYWNDDWGDKLGNADAIREIVRSKLATAPKLVPIYAHRYVPMIAGKGQPVFSVHGIDVIVYGKSLDDYLEIEFAGKGRPPLDVADVCHVPFWSEVI